MKTKIRLAGGGYGDEGKVIWTGDLPLGGGPTHTVIDETDENNIVTYRPSMIAFHFNASDFWQTVFVVPDGTKTWVKTKPAVTTTPEPPTK